MKVTDLFETTECSRCLGSGHYSYNQIDGTRCYGCNGSGIKLTKAGAAAKAAWIAGYTVTVHVQNIRVGDKVMISDHMRGGREIIRTVIASSPDELNPGQNRWTLRFDTSNGGLGGLGTFLDTEIRLPASAEDKKAAYDAIAHMKGALGWGVKS